MDNQFFNELEIPQEIFVAIVTRKGFHYAKPLKVQWDSEAKGWRDLLDKVFITKLGLSVRPYYISYSSPEREKVSSWMLGIRSCNYLHKTSPLLTFCTLDENQFYLKKKYNERLEEDINNIKIEDDHMEET